MNTKRLYFGTLCVVGKKYNHKTNTYSGVFNPTKKPILMKEHFFYKGIFKNIRTKDIYVIDPYCEYEEKDICIDPNSVEEFNIITGNKKKHLSKRKVFYLYNDAINKGKI